MKRLFVPYTTASLSGFVLGFVIMYGSINVIQAIAQNNDKATIRKADTALVINQNNNVATTTISTESKIDINTSTTTNDNTTLSPIIMTGKVIYANLKDMHIQAYQDGQLLLDEDIVSKGRPGSFFETPPGIYDVGIKQKTHFSSIGHVYMPYSMQFFGNYFIHGIPYHENGVKVDTTYSGGCIRLQDDIAKRLYEFADNNTKIIVVNDSPTNEEIVNIPIKNLTASSYIALDIRTGKTISSLSENTLYPIASISKLITALTSLETINQDKSVTITESIYNIEGDSGKLLLGGEYNIKDLLYPLLLTSSNDAAYAIARPLGTKLFVQKMNEKINSMGLKHTHMDDPSGLSSLNTSTAYDLAQLIKYIYENKPYIIEILNDEYKTINGQTWFNKDDFIMDERHVAGKTGYTDEAQYTYASIFNIKSGEDYRPVAIVILQSQDRHGDIAKIIQTLEANNFVK